MIYGVISTSTLKQRAEARNYRKIAKAPSDIQVEIFRETLSDLDNYLDTSDLRMLTSRSLKIIRDDILEIIKGTRNLRGKISLDTVRSLDGALDELRLARDSMQVALGMFNLLGQFDDKKSKKLLAEMRTARKQIEKSLRMLRIK
jgi:hypothetical protein